MAERPDGGREVPDHIAAAARRCWRAVYGKPFPHHTGGCIRWGTGHAHWQHFEQRVSQMRADANDAELIAEWFKREIATEEASRG